MMPSPPTCMRPRITTSPNVDQYDGVSTTISPVTHTALVDVNSAVMNDAPPSPARDSGSISSTVPRATAAPNPVTTTCAG